MRKYLFNKFIFSFLLFLSFDLLFSQTQILTDIDGQAATDYSGYKVAISDDGTRIAIGEETALGSQNVKINARGSGQVRIFDYSESGWVQVGSNIDGEGAGDLFGWPVSLSSDGTRLAVGADNNDDKEIDAGHVRVYDYTASGWSQICSDIDGEAQADKSGYSVSLAGDGTRIAIGAKYNDGGGNNAGHVRVYEASSCSQVGADLDGATADDNFGYSVSISDDGSILAVGSPNFDGNGSNAGRVYIYEFSNGSWSQVGSGIDGGTAGDTFGQAVSINSAGDRVAVGAPGNGAGHVSIFQYNAGNWTQLGSDIDGENAGDKFGYATSFDLDGDHVAIGGYGNDGTASNAGHARVYKYIDGDWNPVGLDLDGEAGGDLFGWGIALDADGDRVVVGGPANDDGGNDAGHVRVYDPYDRTQPTIVITADEGVDGFSSKDANISLTFTISEATSTFIEADITVSNGSLSAFTKVSSTVYTAKLTPINGGEVTIDVVEKTFLDLFTNLNIAAEQFNWFYDIDPPEIVFNPLNGSVGVALNTIITLTFNEAIRKASDDSEITNSTVDDLITLKLTNSSGATIAFDATINAGKTIITINPTSDFTGEQVIYVAIDATVEDAADNAISAASATFTVVTTALPSPLNKTNVTASIKAMSGVAIDAVAMNFNAVEHRVSWLNANVGSNKLSHQGVRLNFANPTVNKLMNTAYVKPGKLDLSNEFVKLIRNNIKDGEAPEATAITDDTKQGLSSVGFNEFAKVREDTIDKVLNATGDTKVMSDWNVWTEGRITVGKTYKTDTSAAQDSQTQNLSLGFDRIIKDNNNSDSNPNASGHIVGVVLGIGKSDADTTNNSTVDADSYSLSAYGVIRQDDKALAQAMMGYGHIKVDKTRIDGSDTLTGNHAANQFFTSIKVQKETIGVGSFSLSPYGKIHASRTWYDGYSETGGNTALTYGEQTIDSTVLSVGLDVDYLIPIHKGNIRPFMQYEYGADVSGSSTVVMHYNNEATNYQLELDNKADSNWKFVLGADMYTKDEWGSSISYERTEAVNAGYSDSLAVKVGLRF